MGKMGGCAKVSTYNPAGDYELKYVFHKGHLDRVLHWLQNHYLPDPVYPYGTVSSIYFDTKAFRFVEEKRNSDFIKVKFRIRWYSSEGFEVPGEVSFLEIKKKIGSTREKRRMQTAISGRYLEAADLSADLFLDIAGSLTSLGEWTGEVLLPLFQVTYKRWRFIEPLTGVRLCVDCDISVPKVNESIFPHPLMSPLEKGVFEVKGGVNELPRGLHPLLALGCQRESFSKYLTCFDRLMARRAA